MTSPPIRPVAQITSTRSYPAHPIVPQEVLTFLIAEAGKSACD